ARPLGLGQELAYVGSLRLGARDKRLAHRGRRRFRAARRGRPRPRSPRPDRNRAPSLPPAADDDRSGKRRHPTGACRRSRRLGARSGGAGSRRPRPPPCPLSGAAFRRRAAARRDRPRHRAASAADLRRRADRQSRREDRRRHRRAAFRAPRGNRSDADHHHPRRGVGGAVRPGRYPGRRAHRFRHRCSQGGMTTLSWPVAWRIARRDLHRPLRGLRLLLVCLFLGVGALAAIGTLTGAIRGELDAQGREILGGDLEVEVWQRPLSAEELALLGTYGEVSQGLRMQAMASTGEAATPIELKAVDDDWPLYGTLTLADGREAGAPPAGQAWIAAGAAERLGIGPGDRFRVGTADLVVGGIIDAEPDRLSEGFQLGQTVIVPLEVPAAAGLTAPGAMYQSKTRERFSGGDDAAEVEEAIVASRPEAGYDIRRRERASPGAERFVGRMGAFLTLVGLAALAIAGIGIGGGVASYLEARRGSIATLKILGAT